MRALALALICALAGCSSMYTPRSGPRVSMVMRDGAIVYVREGRVYPMGLAGGGLVDAVRGNPAAEEAARTFETRMTIGWVCLLTAVAGTVWLSYRVIDTNDVDELDAYIVGGILTLEVGALWAIMTAQPYHYDALNIFNDSVAP